MEEVKKRVYAKPTILKVQLNHEQAVLSVCSTASPTIQSTSIYCNRATMGVGCRKGNLSPSRTDMTTSS